MSALIVLSIGIACFMAANLFLATLCVISAAHRGGTNCGRTQ
ncbi:MAG TPA: hypothetical protein VNH64_00820 [Parvularculaceae bacterium]|nr:hypothetical protein [Parvularculaceae bacterium]